MIVRVTEDYMGAAAAERHELGAAMCKAHGHGAPAKDPADFQLTHLWASYHQIQGIARARMARVGKLFDRAVEARGG